MAYANVSDVAAYLGRSLTPSQETQAQFLLDAASEWVNQYTGKVWDNDSPTTETLTAIGSILFLSNKPVVSITSIEIKPIEPGSQTTVLVAGSNYELINPVQGIISIHRDILWQRPYLATIVYEHTATVPANIKLATVALAAYKLNVTLNPSQSRIKSLNDNRAVNITFKDDVVPKDVLQLLPPKLAYIV